MTTINRADLKRLLVDLAELPVSMVDEAEALNITLEHARAVNLAALKAKPGAERVAAARAALQTDGWAALRASVYGGQQ